jgi:hypothetical protein
MSDGNGPPFKKLRLTPSSSSKSTTIDPMTKTTTTTTTTATTATAATTATNDMTTSRSISPEENTQVLPDADDSGLNINNGESQQQQKQKLVYRNDEEDEASTPPSPPPPPPPPPPSSPLSSSSPFYLSENVNVFSISSVDKLNNNHYLSCLRAIESKLKNMRLRLMQGDLLGIEEEQYTLKIELQNYLMEFGDLINNRILHAKDLKILQSFEEFIETYLLPQINLYEMDIKYLLHSTPVSNREVPLYLGVVQEQAGPIFKDKPIGPFTIRLLTGATVQQVHAGPIQPEICDGNQRVKRNNPDLENARQSFNENGVAVFNDLKFQSGTFPNLVRIKFKVTLQAVIEGQTVTRTIESQPSKPFISMTNTGKRILIFKRTHSSFLIILILILILSLSVCLQFLILRT